MMIQIDRDMPKNCWCCSVEHLSINYFCGITGYITDDVRLKERHPECPLVEVFDNNEEYKEESFLSKRAYYFLKSLPKGARVKIDNNNHFIIQDCDNIYKIYYRDFIPALTLEHERWYEVSELLKWKVEEDE